MIHCPLPAGPLHLVGHPKQHHLAPPPSYHTFPENLTSSHGNSFWKYLPNPAPPLLSTATPPNPRPLYQTCCQAIRLSLLFFSKCCLTTSLPFSPSLLLLSSLPSLLSALLISLCPGLGWNALIPQLCFLQGLGLSQGLPSSSSPGLYLPLGIF